MHGIAQWRAVSRRGGARACWPKPASTEHDLACGPHAPMYEPAAERFEGRRHGPDAHSQQLFGQTCRHAGACAASRLADRAAITCPHTRCSNAFCRRSPRGAASARRPSRLAVDGCGLPTFALPLDAGGAGVRAVRSGRRRRGTRRHDRRRHDRPPGVRRRHRPSVHAADAPGARAPLREGRRRGVLLRRRSRAAARHRAEGRETAPAARRSRPCWRCCACWTCCRPPTSTACTISARPHVVEHARRNCRRRARAHRARPARLASRCEDG